MKNLDILSDPITLHYDKLKTHTSIISLIISIITILISITYGLYLFLELIHHLNPQSFCYTRQEKNIGDFPLNESSMFHFFNFGNAFQNRKLEEIIEIIGFMNTDETLLNYGFNLGSRLSFSHYIYGKCPLNSNKYKLNHIQDLLKNNPLKDSYCIVGYYNKTNNTYITINNENFRYPVLKNGVSDDNYAIYQIVIRSCENDTFNNFNTCKSQNDIDQIISENITTSVMNILNQEVDVSNYKEPIIHSLIQITSALDFGDSFSVNNVNFQPLRVRSFNDLIFNSKYKDDNSYYYEQNDIKNLNSNFPIYSTFIFWMQNKVYIFERSYRKISHFIVDFGGTLKIIFSIAKIINYLFYKYKTFLDINKMLINRINILKNKKKNKNLSESSYIKTALNNFNNKNESRNNMISRYSQNNIFDFSNKKNKNNNVLSYSFSFILKNKKKNEKFGFFSNIYYQLCNKRNKKGLYKYILNWYYKQIISEENLFDLYFYCLNLEKKDQNYYLENNFNNKNNILFSSILIEE